jgi:hypothetical protein
LSVDKELAAGAQFVTVRLDGERVGKCCAVAFEKINPAFSVNNKIK